MRKLMWFTLGFGTACAWGSYFANEYALAIMITAAVLALAFGLLGKKQKLLGPAAKVCLGICIGICWFAAFEKTQLAAPRELDGKTLQVTIRAADYSRKTDYGYAVDGELELDGRAYSVVTYLNEDDETFFLSPGDRVTGTFRFTSTTEGDRGSNTYHQGNGVFLTASQRKEIEIVRGEPDYPKDFPAVFRGRILTLIQTAFAEDTAPFAKALLLGDSSGLSYQTDTAFKVSGIRHIIAVSGLHVSMLFSVVYVLSGKRRVLTALLGIPVLALFAAVAGLTPSVTRACIMQGLMLLALLFDREYDPPTALAFAALVMLTINPLTITSVSFQLSVGCMVGICLFAGKIRGWILSDKCLGEVKGKSVKAKLKRWFASGVSMTLSTMVVTTPLCAWYFGMVSLVGIVTNLLTLWIVTYIFVGIIIVCIVGSFWNAAAGVLAWVVSWGIRYVILVAGVLAEFPVAAVYTKSIYTVIWMVFCYLLLAVYLYVKKRPLVFGCCAVVTLCLSLLLSWTEPVLDNCRMTVLDMGQGQCILLQSDERNYLVDCGGQGPETSADEAAELLLSQGITRLDGVILTHFDSDHSAGVANLLTRVDADMVFVSEAEDEAGIAESIATVTAGSIHTVGQTLKLSFDDTSIVIIPSHLRDSGNESSLCVLFQRENCAILITGDRDAFGERMLLRNMNIPDLDVLVVGHHGSKNSTSQALLEATRPEVAIISVGANNPYGHPAQEILDRLEEFGCVVYRTDLHGTIIFRR